MVEFEDMVASRGAVLLRFALMLCGDPHLAEDLVQSVLAKAYRRWEKIARAEQPEAYLKKMIVNEHLGWWRRRASRELPLDGPPRRDDPYPSGSADHTAGHASRDAAWVLLERLPRRQRAILVLRYYEDQSNEQIAAILGCAPSTVRSNATRALAALRAVMPTLDQEALP
jgi:RNA polymerase sigma-70 factor (sigma-E family)